MCFQIESFVGLIHIFMLNGFLVGVLYTLGPTPSIQRQYVTILGFSITLTIFYCERGTIYQYTGVLLIIFVLYLLAASKTQSKDIRNMFVLEERLVNENRMLKETRQELEIQKAKAEYSTRLAALGEMAGGVGHEINNPLGIIAGNTDLLRSKLMISKVDPTIWQGHVDKITEIVTRIAKIVRSLQNLARKTDSTIPEKIDLMRVIHETLDLSSEKFKMRSIKLKFQHEGPVWVLGHHVEIGQVLINLINNAYDAVKTADEKVISLSISQTDDEVILSIQDSGAGVADEIREKLFQPFFTTKAIGEGSGLGLSISRSLLVKVGGDLVLTHLRNPTEFQVILKRAT
jgi:C4-dicarboxylate-specific signal transduction histidine kinase